VSRTYGAGKWRLSDLKNADGFNELVRDLAAHIRKLQADIANKDQALDELLYQRNQLQAKVAGLERDAARLDYLANSGAQVLHKTHGVCLNAAQKKWCKTYQAATGFEPLMDDFEAGNETFLEAVQKSTVWFEDWANDALLKITRGIPEE